MKERCSTSLPSAVRSPSPDDATIRTSNVSSPAAPVVETLADDDPAHWDEGRDDIPFEAQLAARAAPPGHAAEGSNTSLPSAVLPPRSDADTVPTSNLSSPNAPRVETIADDDPSFSILDQGRETPPHDQVDDDDDVYQVYSRVRSIQHRFDTEHDQVDDDDEDDVYQIYSRVRSIQHRFDTESYDDDLSTCSASTDGIASTQDEWEHECHVDYEENPDAIRAQIDTGAFPKATPFTSREAALSDDPEFAAACARATIQAIHAYQERAYATLRESLSTTPVMYHDLPFHEFEVEFAPEKRLNAAQLRKALLEHDHDLFSPEAPLDDDELTPELDVASIRAIATHLHPDLDFSESSISNADVGLCINALQSRNMTDEEEALGSFTRNKLKRLSTWPEWQAGEFQQLDRFHALQMYGAPVPRPTDPNAIILRPHWQYKVKSDGKRRSRNCCDGSPRAAPVLHGIASTYSSCVEQPIQRLFFALSAHLGYGVYGGDATDAYAHSPPPEVPTYVAIDEAYADWYERRFGTRLDRSFVLLGFMPFKVTPSLVDSGKNTSTRSCCLRSLGSAILPMTARSTRLPLMVSRSSCYDKWTTLRSRVPTRTLPKESTGSLVNASSLHKRQSHPLNTTVYLKSTMASTWSKPATPSLSSVNATSSASSVPITGLLPTRRIPCHLVVALCPLTVCPLSTQRAGRWKVLRSTRTSRWPRVSPTPLAVSDDLPPVPTATAPAKLIAFVDATHANDLRNRRSNDLTKALGWVLHARHARRIMGHYR